MERKKIVDRCAYLVSQIKALRESDILNGIECGPQGLFSMWPSGMPRGTNDREAAMFQREDVDGALDRLEKMEEELDHLLLCLERDVA